MRKPGDWYVLTPWLEIGDGCILRCGCKDGDTPEQAVLQAWREFTEELPPNNVLVLNAMSPDRRTVRWNGFMWQDWHL